jgi:hypothetical protein
MWLGAGARIAKCFRRTPQANAFGCAIALKLIATDRPTSKASTSYKTTKVESFSLFLKRK